MAANPSLRALGVFQESDRYFQVVLRNGVEPKSIKTMGVFPPGIGLYFTNHYLASLGIDPHDGHTREHKPARTACFAGAR